MTCSICSAETCSTTKKAMDESKNTGNDMGKENYKQGSIAKTGKEKTILTVNSEKVT